MKSKNFLSIYFLGLVLMSGCKKDSDVSTSNGQSSTSFANTHYQFSLKCDGITYTATDGIGGFTDLNFDVDHDTLNYTNWEEHSFFVSGDSTNPEFSIESAILKMQGETVSIDDLRMLFQPGSHPLNLDPNSGIVILFSKRNAETMYSNYGTNPDQTGSSFIITDTLTEQSLLGPSFKIRARFNCKVYDHSQVAHTITDGNLVCFFQANH